LGYEKGEENHDKDRVCDRIPMNLGRHHIIFSKVNIPTRSPFDRAWVPQDIIGEKNWYIFLYNLRTEVIFLRHVNTWARARKEWLSVSFIGFSIPLVVIGETMVDTDWFYRETHNTIFFGNRSFYLMVVNVDVHMVKDKRIFGG